MNTTQFEYTIETNYIRLTKYIGKEEVVSLPEEIDGLPVRILGAHCFYENGGDIRKIVVPKSVRIIEEYACEFCLSLEELVLSDGVEQLKKNFIVFTAQESLYIPASVNCIEHIGELNVNLIFSPDNPYYFSDGFGIYHKESSGITLETTVSSADMIPVVSYAVKSGTTRISSDAFFYQEHLKELFLPDSLIQIDSGALSNSKNQFEQTTGISTIHLSPSHPVFFLDQTGFYERLSDGTSCLIKYLGRHSHIDLPETVSIIGKGAFSQLPVEKLKIPKSVQTILPDAFIDCPLSEVYIESLSLSIYLPGQNHYLLKQVLRGFGRHDQFYDFHYYDELLEEDTINLEKVRMRLYRLTHPFQLSQKQENYYRTHISKYLDTILLHFAEEKRLSDLQTLCQLGFFTKENIDNAINTLNQPLFAESLAIIMNYKHAFLGTDDFDFSL